MIARRLMAQRIRQYIKALYTSLYQSMTCSITERLASMEGVAFKDENDNGGGVSFVVIPADTSIPPQELVLLTNSSSNIQTMFEDYFRIQKGETVDMELLQQQANEARTCSTYMCPHVSPSTLKRAAQEGTLQSIRVSGDTDNNVDMYYDESANLKYRPLNKRANHYVNGDESIHGDVFLVCMQENQQPSSLTMDALEKQSWFIKSSKEKF